MQTATYVSDIEAFFRHVEVKTAHFGGLPTSTTVEVRKLAYPDFMVKIEAIAVIDRAQERMP